MLTNAEPQQMDLSATQEVSRHAEQVLARDIWLPKLIYDCLPYFYLTAGFAAFFATLYISEWFWVLPHYLMISAACMHFAFLVYRRRHRAHEPTGGESGEEQEFTGSSPDEIHAVFDQSRIAEQQAS